MNKFRYGSVSLNNPHSVIDVQATTSAYEYDASADLVVESGGESVNLSEFIQSVKEALGQSPVILKCSHCGQWGAKFCACVYCGAPIG